MSEFNTIKFDTNPYHNMMLKDRKYLEISGVKQIESFDDQVFVVESVQGWLEVVGNDLTLDRLDKERGEVKIKGNIEGIQYLDHRKTNKESLMKRLFR